jgi:hypothetical protein
MGYLKGLDIIGLGGIYAFYSEAVKKKLNESIERVIIKCEVEMLVFITDADTLTINYEPSKDLYLRPNSFYTAIADFREATNHIRTNKDAKLKDVYFGHIKSTYINKCKGLDDLFIHQVGKEEQIIYDLKQLTLANKYFNIINISDNDNAKLRRYFGIQGKAEDFYNCYSEFIGNSEFIYRGRKYFYDGEKVIFVRHQDADDYMRIGCDWFRVINIPDRHGELHPQLITWKISEISRDYEKKFPGFIESIPKYNAFVNMPANDENYRLVHENCFNIYHPLLHKEKEGDISNSIKFLKHLFGGEGDVKVTQNLKTKSFEYTECANLGDPFTVALDYLTIMYRIPTQILPVPCLVSPENNTGKSSFLKWLKDIYGSNSTILGNEEFKMPFNSHYITKFIIGIDEGFIDVDKKADKERIKKLATDDRQFLQYKGVDVKEIDFYGKIIICSNDADRLMKIDEGEIRWFIIKVPTFEKEDPDFRAKLRNEIPAWLNFLKNREIVHPKEGRAWFHPKYLVTDQLKVIINTTKPKLSKEIDDYIEDMFLRFQLSSIHLHVEYLTEAINKYSKFKYSKVDVKNYLKKDRGMAPSPNPFRYQLPIDFIINANGQVALLKTEHNQRAYTFHAEKWLSEDVFKDFKPVNDEPETDEN